MSTDLSLETVTKWLAKEGYALTALELYKEVKETKGEVYAPLLTVVEQTISGGDGAPCVLNEPATDSDISEVDRSDDARLLREALALFKQTKGTDAFKALLKGLHECDASDGDPLTVQQLRQQHTELESKFQLTVRSMAERLPILVHSVDPSQKEVLLPLMRLVAIFSSTHAGRTAARQHMLGLFKRPTRSNRAAIAEEWVRVAQTASSHHMQQEIIPELYSLVNARAVERRLLAVDCVMALSPLVKDAHKTRRQLSQGLLRQLSEDESSAVRCEVPACLSALWVEPSRLTKDGVDDVAERFSQEDFMLILRLAIDPYSNSVRIAAQTQLREIVYPRCLEKHILLRRCVPLILSLLADEMTPLIVSGGDAAPREGANWTSSENTIVLAHTNVVTLVQLAHDALSCIKSELLNNREQLSDEEEGEYIQLVGHFYTEVILPSIYSLLLPALLQLLPTTRQDTRLMESLSGLVVSVASIVPLLNDALWQRIKTFLCASVSIRREENETSLLFREVIAATENTILKDKVESADLLSCTLFIFYIFLIRIAGQQTAFLEGKRNTSVFANRIGTESTTMMTDTFVTKAAVSTLVDTDARLSICGRAMASLGSMAFDNDNVAAGIMAVLWSCADSSDITQRMHAITLVTRTCSYASDSAVKTTFVCPPLLSLLKDKEPSVQEMTVKAFLSVGVFMTDTASQEKILRPALSFVESLSCTSNVTTACLHQWETLLARMPAEPRETFLYPQLGALMQKLIEEGLKERSGTSTPVHMPGRHPEGGTTDRWELTLVALMQLLEMNLRCAVVTPVLVSKYLIPGMRRINSEESLFGTIPTSLRTRWLRLQKAYDVFIEKNSGITAQHATNLIHMVREELKKHF
ncbi:hypothetical protein STCU_04814 [Strigomonas culicis]|uniref:LisH domain-containing protein n=1 Tax=Strigomonas culicis TaxID=28005 RepID=S9UDM3_9TRYP|nr:hypothetical protein STCU_07664 [Strigomonas culicis]EPY28922.1 hypothetical protein STCU_04814 [Strigomonas culicis]|eukprot:EPY23547.1 hypothetical protein STCU_07664 [Strigomonas culicis]